jgi:hypothetical protein
MQASYPSVTPKSNHNSSSNNSYKSHNRPLNTTDHPLQGWFQVVTVFSYLNVLMVLFCLPFAFGQGLNFLEMRFLTLPAFLPVAFIVASKMGMVTIETFSKQKRNGSGPRPNALAMGLTALLGVGFIAAGGLYFGYKTDYCNKEKDSYICAFFNDPFMEMIFAGALVIIFLAFAWKAYTTIFKGTATVLKGFKNKALAMHQGMGERRGFAMQPSAMHQGMGKRRGFAMQPSATTQKMGKNLVNASASNAGEKARKAASKLAAGWKGRQARQGKGIPL